LKQTGMAKCRFFAFNGDKSPAPAGASRSSAPEQSRSAGSPPRFRQTSRFPPYSGGIPLFTFHRRYFHLIPFLLSVFEKLINLQPQLSDERRHAGRRTAFAKNFHL